MFCDRFFLLKNVSELRKAIETGAQTPRQRSLWNMMLSCARSGPLNYPWFTPFVAVVTQEKQDVENAKRVIATYADKLNHQNYCTGLQFHFWCFAFPHAKWAMYYQWLCALGAYTPEEREELDAVFLNYQFTNFYYGMRTKPEPECADNQTLSLTLSNVIVGYLFSDTRIGKIMLRDGLKRLPEIIGRLPASGYTGEGSDYMDCVNGPAMWICCEALEEITGEKGVAFKRFEPNGVRPVDVLDICAREWMPGGLLLPWDNYGYNCGVKAPVAYAAKITGNARYYEMLEKDADWAYDIGTGWAYDDMVWTLIFWPTQAPSVREQTRNWFVSGVGGALVGAGDTQYLMQMWDESGVECPTRSHVNPNAVIFNAYHLPVSADGSKMEFDCTRFEYPDTWRVVDFLSMDSTSRYNYGDGCIGAHSCVIVDGNESMRAMTEYPQTKSEDCSAEEGYLSSDATPLYAEHFPDAIRVSRKSSLHCDRFFVIEDDLRFGEEHLLTSRFLLRPGAEPCENGVRIVTPEGVVLSLCEVGGGSEISVENVKNYPHKPDLACVIADFNRRAKKLDRLFVAFMSKRFSDYEQIGGFRAVADEKGDLCYREAAKLLSDPGETFDLSLPPFMEREAKICSVWWFGKKIAKKEGKAVLVLPAGLIEPELYFNGKKFDLSPYDRSMQLIRPHVSLPDEFSGEGQIDVVLKTRVPVDHYYGKGWGTYGMNGGVSLAYAQEEERPEKIEYDGKTLRVRTNQKEYVTEYVRSGDEK